MIDEQLASWALSGIDGIGPAAFLHLTEKFGSAAAVFDKSPDEILSAEVVNKHLASRIASQRDWEQLSIKFQKSVPENSQVVCLAESSYPSKLKNIPDPPPLIYYAGDINIFERPTLAVVGSRKPTDYGIRLASRIVTELAAAGVDETSPPGLRLESRKMSASTPNTNPMRNPVRAQDRRSRCNDL